MKHNRLISLALSLLMLFTLLSACGSGDKTDGSGSKDPGRAVTNPDASQTPTPEPEPDPVDLQAFYEAITGEYEFGMLELAPAEILDNFYPGMSAVDTQQCLVYICAISSNMGEFGLVQVTNEADVETVKDIFQARIDYMVGDGNGPGGAWYPMAMTQWEENSQVVSNGNYVMMVVHENKDDIIAKFNELF